MALKVSFDMAASIREQQAIAERVVQDVIRAQSYAGEQFVTDCRQQIQSHEAGTYIDQTANLRNSIGYFIRIDGEVVKKQLFGSGISESEAMAALNAVPVRMGIQLIGLAGMNYASAVEAKGYNVMSLQADAALIDLTGYYKAIEDKYK